MEAPSPDLDPTAPLFESAALVTIDVQCDTLDGQPLEVRGTSDCLPAISALAAAFRLANRPIVHMVRIYLPDGSNAELSRKGRVSGSTPVLRPGTRGRDLASGVTRPDAPPLDDALLLGGHAQELGPDEHALYKPRWGAFFATTLDAHLQAAGVTTIVVAGCNFPNCPRTSIYEASERDYRVVVADDAISGLYERGHAELSDIGVRALPSELIAARLAAGVT